MGWYRAGGGGKGEEIKESYATFQGSSPLYSANVNLYIKTPTTTLSFANQYVKNLNIIINNNIASNFIQLVGTFNSNNFKYIYGKGFENLVNLTNLDNLFGNENITKNKNGNLFTKENLNIDFNFSNSKLSSINSLFSYGGGQIPSNVYFNNSNKIYHTVSTFYYCNPENVSNIYFNNEFVINSSSAYNYHQFFYMAENLNIYNFPNNQNGLYSGNNLFYGSNISIHFSGNGNDRNLYINGSLGNYSLAYANLSKQDFEQLIFTKNAQQCLSSNLFTKTIFNSYSGIMFSNIGDLSLLNSKIQTSDFISADTQKIAIKNGYLNGTNSAMISLNKSKDIFLKNINFNGNNNTKIFLNVANQNELNTIILEDIISSNNYTGAQLRLYGYYSHPAMFYFNINTVLNNLYIKNCIGFNNNPLFSQLNFKNYYSQDNNYYVIKNIYIESYNSLQGSKFSIRPFSSITFTSSEISDSFNIYYNNIYLDNTNGRNFYTPFWINSANMKLNFFIGDNVQLSNLSNCSFFSLGAVSDLPESHINFYFNNYLNLSNTSSGVISNFFQFSINYTKNVRKSIFSNNYLLFRSASQYANISTLTQTDMENGCYNSYYNIYLYNNYNG